VTKDVENTITKGYKDRAKKCLGTIDDIGQDEECSVKTELLLKEELPKLKEELQTGAIDYLIVNYTQDKFIAKDVLDYQLDNFLEDLDLNYEVYYDGEFQKKHKGTQG
jgi:hypothetical protein